MPVQTFKAPDGTEMVILPKKDLEAASAEFEDLADGILARDILAKIASGEEEVLPADFVARLVRGSNPLSEWRKYRGLTQARLAKAVGVSQPRIAQIERGGDMPLTLAKKLARVLAMDIDDLA